MLTWGSSAALANYADSPFRFTFTVYEDRRPAAVYDGPSILGVATPLDAFQGHAAEPVSVAGGPIFLPLGLIASAPEEAVLAFQLAHAMAHIAARHATKWATRTELMQVQPTSMGGPAIPMGWLSFARAGEREADYLAVQTLMKAGYDPEAMADYLSQQPVQQQGSVSKVFSPHVPNKNRAAAIRAELEKLPPATYHAAAGGFAEAKALAANVR